MRAIVGLVGVIVSSMEAFNGLMETIIIGSMGAVCSMRASVVLMGDIVVGSMGAFVDSMRAINGLIGVPTSWQRQWQGGCSGGSTPP
jgi:hypothetical protein